VDEIIRGAPYPVELRQSEHKKSLTFYKEFIKMLDNDITVNRVPLQFQPGFISMKLTPSQRESVEYIKNFLKTFKKEKKQLLYGCIASGGCGKSALLKIISSMLNERSLGYEIVSYTAISASACNGITIHSFLGLNYAVSGGTEYMADMPVNNKLRERCKRIEFLLIDEVGFLNCDFLNLINKRCQKARNNTRDFGGINVLVFGDFHQLPPIFPPELYTDKTDLKAFSSEGQMLFKRFKLFGLYENVRAINDTAFQQFCVRVRIRELTNEDIDKLRERRMSNLPPDERLEFHNSLHIFPRNASVHAFNLAKLIQMQKPIVRIKPKQKLGSKELPDIETLYLCDNAPIVLTSNLNFKYGLLNGSRGKVHSIYYKKGTSPSNSLPSVVFVKIDNYNGLSCEQTTPGLLPICPKADKYYDRRERKSIPYTSIPLRLGFASSVHGVQSLTLEKFVIHFDCREYFFGQTYVSLSRGTSFQSFAVFDEELSNLRFSSPFISSQYEQFKNKLRLLGIHSQKRKCIQETEEEEIIHKRLNIRE